MLTGMRALACGVLLVACSKSGSGTGTGAGTGAAASDPCGAAALGLGKATLMTPWKMPDGCELVGVGESIILRDDNDAAAHTRCTGAPLGHDFTKAALVVKQDTLSPASTGIIAYDNGTTITWVTTFRTPCPDDPQPMPVPITLVYPVEAKAGRAFDDKNCTRPTPCDRR
jgi:hypothetical protein